MAATASGSKTHQGLVIVAPRAPYEVHKFPTVSPERDEIRIAVKWTASSPLDLHQADGGLLVQPPMRTGSTSAGIVVETGPDVKYLRVRDAVFGFAHQQPAWKAHQEYATAPEWVFGKIPEDFTFEKAVTLPDNLVTAFNTISRDLGLPTPWPKPGDYVPPRADDGILVWGASSSIGQLTIQVLKWYGYRNIIATASPRHHEYLFKEMGASKIYDYGSPTVVTDLLSSKEQSGDGNEPNFPLIVDCIGPQAGSVKPLSMIAQSGSTVAVMLPVIVKHASDSEAPAYSMDVAASAEWAPGVNVRGVRTHFYWQNPLFKEKLQLKIIPALLAQGIVKPNQYRIIEGKSLLDRATKALDQLRQGVSGEKLIWRVSEA